MSRYARQICLPEVGVQGQARLAAARVLVVGAGGLGAALLPQLAGAGVGYLRVIDPDHVEESNLHRQTLFRMSDIGRPKAMVAAEALAALNPDCRIDPAILRLDPASARAEIAHVDLVVDAADAFAVTYALSDLCLLMGKPFISASVLGRMGYVGGFCSGSPSYRCVFPDLPATLANCAAGGVMGPVVATLGALQAQMVLSVLLNHDPNPLGQLISMDLQTWQLASFRFDDAPEPEHPGPMILALTEVQPDDLVIELRDAAEAPDLPLSQALRMSASELTGFAPDAGRRVVFSCATGLRAWRAARQLALRCENPTAVLTRSR